MDERALLDHVGEYHPLDGVARADLPDFDRLAAIPQRCTQATREQRQGNDDSCDTGQHTETPHGQDNNARHAEGRMDMLLTTQPVGIDCQELRRRKHSWSDSCADAIDTRCGQTHRGAGRPVTFGSQGTAGPAFGAGCSAAGQAAACCWGHRWDRARVRPTQ